MGRSDKAIDPSATAHIPVDNAMRPLIIVKIFKYVRALYAVVEAMQTG